MIICPERPLLTVVNVEMGYRRRGEWLPVLAGITFDAHEGEFLCLVGPSGCGKTTLLRLLAGLERPTAGLICLDGVEVSRPSRAVGLVFQEPTLMSWRTVVDNIVLPLEIGGVPREELRCRGMQMVRLVGLEGFENSYPAHLSGGMAQRVALARALIHRPRLLLLDEPFGALDALTRERMGYELLRVWQAGRRTAIMVTHSITEAVLLADRVLVLGPRPATIVAEVRVDLPRPRPPEVIGAPAFERAAGEVRRALFGGRA